MSNKYYIEDEIIEKIILSNKYFNNIYPKNEYEKTFAEMLKIELTKLFIIFIKYFKGKFNIFDYNTFKKYFIEMKNKSLLSIDEIESFEYFIESLSKEEDQEYIFSYIMKAPIRCVTNNTKDIYQQIVKFEEEINNAEILENF